MPGLMRDHVEPSDLTASSTVEEDLSLIRMALMKWGKGASIPFTMRLLYRTMAVVIEMATVVEAEHGVKLKSLADLKELLRRGSVLFESVDERPRP